MNFQNLSDSRPGHMFGLAPLHDRHFRVGHILFTLVLRQNHQSIQWNTSQADHAIFVVMRRYIVTRKNKITPPKNRFSYLVYKRSGERCDANGGEWSPSCSLRHSCDVTLLFFFFEFLDFSDSWPSPTRPPLTLLSCLGVGGVIDSVRYSFEITMMRRRYFYSIYFITC